jgi:large subunit ribosomal protein LP2
MRYVAAALLTALAGNEVNAANIEKILSSVGVEVDKKNLDIVIKNLAGKSVEELMAAGSKKLASMPSGGGAAAAAPAAAAGGAAAPAAAKKEEKVEEEEEEDDDMGFGLFD